MHVFIEDDLIEFYGLDGESIVDRATEALAHPADSGWSDKDLWKTHTLMFATPDKSLTDEYLADWSNYRSALRELSADYPNDVEEATFRHWTYSRFMAVKIRVVTDTGAITEAFVKALQLEDSLEHNHLLDEDDFMELEDEVRTLALKEIADDIKVSYDGLIGAMNALNVYYTPGYGFDLYKVTEEDLVKKARELSNMFDQHVDSGSYHDTEYCFYCVRATEVTA